MDINDATRIFESYKDYYAREFFPNETFYEFEDDVENGQFYLAYYETDDAEYYFNVVLDINEMAILYYINEILYDIFTYKEINRSYDETVELIISDLDHCNYDQYLSQIFEDGALKKQFNLEWDENYSDLVKVI